MAASTSSIFRTSSEVDLEAQNFGVVLPTPPPAASPSTTSHSSQVGGTNPIDDFFGVSRPRGTSDSRHDAFAIPSLPEEEDMEAPPPYADASDLPSYTAVAEPPTLAMYLFKFGFLFPLFWLAGIIILFSPLQAPENWEPTKTETERQEIIELLRRTERKWAKRCFVAFSVFALVAAAIACAVVMVLRNGQSL